MFKRSLKNRVFWDPDHWFCDRRSHRDLLAKWRSPIAIGDLLIGDHSCFVNYNGNMRYKIADISTKVFPEPNINLLALFSGFSEALFRPNLCQKWWLIQIHCQTHCQSYRLHSILRGRVGGGRRIFAQPRNNPSRLETRKHSPQWKNAYSNHRFRKRENHKDQT